MNGELDSNTTSFALAQRLIELLKAKRLTCSTAESCTGGGIAHVLTAVPGASEVFFGGVVSYVNDVKQRVLGVSENVLNTVGAVSEACAKEMAAGARKLLKSDLAVSVTGLAGPGGDEVHPQGYVWFGVATKQSVSSSNVIFEGDRAAVRARAVEHALKLLIESATKL